MELQRESESAIRTKMVWVDQWTLSFFSVTWMAEFLVKKQHPPRNLASLYLSDVIQVSLCVFHRQREGTETRWHSDSRWSSIAIGRSSCRYILYSCLYNYNYYSFSCALYSWVLAIFSNYSIILTRLCGYANEFDIQ